MDGIKIKIKVTIEINILTWHDTYNNTILNYDTMQLTMRQNIKVQLRWNDD